MVSLEKFSENVFVELDGDALSNRVKKQLNRVVERLPYEEQFEMMGDIYIGHNGWIQNILVEKSISLSTGDPMTVSARDGNIIIGIDYENLEDSWYIITLAVDSLDGMSDDCIMGLIAYKLSEWSRLWREITSIPNLDNLGEELREIIHGIFPSRFPVANREREEYERSVDAEVRRLGFSSELAAYDIR